MKTLAITALALVASQEKPPRDRAVDLYSSANALYNRRLYDLAADQYREFLKGHPRHEKAPGARLGLALSLYSAGKPAEAEPLLAELARDPKTDDRERVHLLWGHALLALGRDAQAERAFAGAGKDPRARTGLLEALFRQSKWKELLEAARGHEADPRAACQVAAARLELKDPKAAIEILERFDPRSPLAPDAALLLAEARLAAGETEAALRGLAGLAGPRAKLLLGRAFRSRGMKEEAERVLTETLRAGERADLLRELGHVLVDGARFKEAAGRFERAGDAWMTAWCLHKAGDYAGSLESLGKAPATRDAGLLRAENLFLLEKYAEARDAYGAFADAPAARFRLAQIFYREKKWGEALTQFEGVPGEAFEDLPYLIGDCALQLGRWDRAVEALTRHLEPPPRPQADAALFKLAQAYERKGEEGKARETLRRLIDGHERSPLRAGARAELGRLLCRAGRLREARDVLIGPADAAASYVLGWVALAEHDEAEARGHFQKALAQDGPAAADAALQLGILNVRARRWDEARPLLERALDSPKAEEARFYLGLGLARQGRWEAAIERLKGVGEGPFRDRALFERALCEKGAGRVAEASARLEGLLGGPLAPEASLELADIAFDRRDFAGALERAEQVLADPGRKDLRPRAACRAGECRLERGEAAEAARLFESVGDSPLAPVAAHLAGEARLRLKDYGSARDHFARSAAAGESHPLLEPSLVRRAECEGLLGRWREAEEAYRAFLNGRSKSPLAPHARFGLGWSVENQGRPEEAAALYRELVEAGGKDAASARAQFQRGECLFGLARGDEAIKELIKVEANYGYPEWSARALLEIGRVLQSQGKRDVAGERYREVLERYGRTEAAAAARQLLDRLGE